MRNLFRSSLLALVVVIARFDERADAQPISAPGATPDMTPVRAYPFYGASGQKLVAPPAVDLPVRSPFVLATSVNASELFIPSLSSDGALIEPMIQMGNDLFAGGIGYANLGGAHGIDLDASIGLWSSAVRLFDTGGWRGSLILPDLDLRFAFFPGQTRLPSWFFGSEMNVTGLRLAKCVGAVSFEMTAAAVAGPMLLKVDRLYGGAVVGSYLDVGIAFWR